MNAMTVCGENYMINRKRVFASHAVNPGILKSVVDFAYDMCFGQGHHRAYRTGGTLIRHAGEKFCNTFQGKLAEVCLRRALIDAGLVCAEPNDNLNRAYSISAEHSGHNSRLPSLWRQYICIICATVRCSFSIRVISSWCTWL